MTSVIPDSARSEEHIWDRRFLSRWADRCIEMYQKYGQQVANSFAKEMFSPELLAEVNKEIANRKKKKK